MIRVTTAPGAHRDVGVGLKRHLLTDLARDRRQPEDVGRGHVQLAAGSLGGHPQHVGEPVVDDGVGLGRVLQGLELVQRHRPGEILGRDLDRQGLDAVDERRPAGVQHLSAGRRDVDLAHPVDRGRLDVLVAGEHLQEPQAEEDDREQAQREAADDGDAQGQLRRQRGAPVLGRRGHPPPRLSCPSRLDGLCSGLRPPVVYARRRRRRGIVGQGRVDDPAHHGVDGQGDEGVDEDRDEDLLEEQQAHRRVDAEQELDERHPDSGHRGRRGARGQGNEPVGGVTQLAQPPGPVADGDVEQRRDPQRLDEHRVHQQARWQSP